MTQKGGISLATGAHTKSDNYETYYSGAKYTMFMNLGNFIPAQGSLKIQIPQEI